MSLKTAIHNNHISMKKHLFYILVLCLLTTVNAQILEPAKWSFDVSQRSLEIGQEIEVIFNVRLDRDWYIYSNDFKAADFGPVPTKIEFIPHTSYELVGDLTPISPKDNQNEIFDLKYRYMDGGGAGFKQRIRILAKNPVVEGVYTYMTCTMVDGKCIAGDGEFDFSETIKVID